MLSKKIKLDRQIFSYDELLNDDTIFRNGVIKKIIQTEICNVEKLVREALAKKDRNIKEIKQDLSTIARDYAEVKAENKSMKSELEKCFTLIQEKNKEIEIILDDNFKKENELMHSKTTIDKYFVKHKELEIILEDNIKKEKELVQCKNTLGKYVEKHIEVLLKTEIDKDDKKRDLKNFNLVIDDKNRVIEILRTDNINKENELVHSKKTIKQYFVKYNEELQKSESEMDSKKGELENCYQSLHAKNEELGNIRDDMTKTDNELVHCKNTIEEKDNKYKELLSKTINIVEELKVFHS